MATLTDQEWFDLYDAAEQAVVLRGAKSYQMPSMGRMFTALDLKEIRDSKNYYRARLVAAKRVGCGVVRFGSAGSPSGTSDGPIVSHFP